MGKWAPLVRRRARKLAFVDGILAKMPRPAAALMERKVFPIQMAANLF
jgi:hypothetical protein